MSELRERLAHLVSLMVDRRDQVEIEEVPHADGTTFKLRVAEEDLGKVIGRQGRTARALRSLLAARQARDGSRYELEILD